MALSIGVSSAWKSVSAVSIGVSGVWKSVTQMWIGVGGAWKALLTLVDLGATRSAQKTSISPTDARTGYRINSSGTHEDGVGTASVSYTDATTWLLSGAAGDYEVRATVTSGSTPSSGTIDTWMACSTTRTWENIITGLGEIESVLLIEVRLASSTVLSSMTVTLTSIVEA